MRAPDLAEIVRGLAEFDRNVLLTSPLDSSIAYLELYLDLLEGFRVPHHVLDIAGSVPRVEFEAIVGCLIAGC